jgi:glycosidase
MIYAPKGIAEKLDHLKDAGVGAVWLSPVYKSPMADFGYDISNFTDIDPIFGTLDDFNRLQITAKELGINIKQDFYCPIYCYVFFLPISGVSPTCRDSCP